MPNSAAAKAIAEQLHELTADDGTVLRDNMLIPRQNMPQQWHDDMKTIKQGRAEGIVRVLEEAGAQIVMPGDLPPVETPPRWVDVYCASCEHGRTGDSKPLFSLVVRTPEADDRGRIKVTLAQMAVDNLLTALHGYTTACPHHPANA